MATFKNLTVFFSYYPRVQYHHMETEIETAPYGKGESPFSYGEANGTDTHFYMGIPG